MRRFSLLIAIILLVFGNLFASRGLTLEFKRASKLFMPELKKKEVRLIVFPALLMLNLNEQYLLPQNRENLRSVRERLLKLMAENWVAQKFSGAKNYRCSKVNSEALQVIDSLVGDFSKAGLQARIIGLDFQSVTYPNSNCIKVKGQDKQEVVLSFGQVNSCWLFNKYYLNDGLCQVSNVNVLFK